MGKKNAIRSLRDRFEKGLLERVPKTSVNGNPFAGYEIPQSVTSGGAVGEAIQLLLNCPGMASSSGSAEDVLEILGVT